MTKNYPSAERTVYKFDPSHLDIIVRVGRQGGSITKMAVECGVLPSTLKAWADPESTRHIPAVALALEFGLAHAQAHYEDIGQMAAQGLIKNHSAATYTFMMKNLFKHAYSDETVTRHAGGLEFSAGMSSIDAETRYKELLANPNATLATPGAPEVALESIEGLGVGDWSPKAPEDAVEAIAPLDEDELDF